MVELLQLVEAGLTVTAVSIAVVVAPAAIITGTELPAISPLLEIYNEKDSISAPEILEEDPT
jgi:hypothetical protein